MCRIISFLSVQGGVGKTSIIYNVSKIISKKDFKVCVIDGYFQYNVLSCLYENKNSIDFEQYIIGRVGMFQVCNKFKENLFFVKTNNLNFDYLKHSGLFKFFIDEISSYFDYILIDVNCFDERILTLFVESSNECFYVLSDEKYSILNTEKLIKRLCVYNNIFNKKLIINKARVLTAKNKKCLNDREISDMLKIETLYVVPKFYKYNNFNNLITNNRYINFYKKLSYNTITNKSYFLTKNNHCFEVFDLIKKCLYYKFE